MLTKNTLAIYIHWPFCAKKCPYCDFNTYAVKISEFDHWLAIYKKEIEHFAKIVGKQNVKTVYFGGGTPSLIPADILLGFIKIIKDNFNFNIDLSEITIEVNPSTVDLNKLIAFKEIGINRLSVGMQSLRDERLQMLGRDHSRAIAIDVINSANKVFDNISLDAIYATPNQSISEWEQELLEILEYYPKHLSLYQLHFYEKTPFFKRYPNDLRLPDKTLIKMYNLTNKIVKSKGMSHYEVSNYSKAGFKSLHNQFYWRYGDYLGIGPGAHGRFNDKYGKKIATSCIKNPVQWAKKIQNASPSYDAETLSKQDIFEEYILMNLRLSDGISHAELSDFLLEFGIEEYINKLNLQPLIDSGHIKSNKNRFFVPDKFKLITDSIIFRLLY